ncbi:hypothetical protein OG21DRAFT_1510017 [Imleria badia]|nr:hypothetical protein OG21DRAFT_1510017 [Imleria badia]
MQLALRPGQMAWHIEFKLASRFQPDELFKPFYSPSSSASAPCMRVGQHTRDGVGNRENGRVNVASRPFVPIRPTLASRTPRLLECEYRDVVEKLWEWRRSSWMERGRQWGGGNNHTDLLMKVRQTMNRGTDPQIPGTPITMPQQR